MAVAPSKYAHGLNGTGRKVPDAYEVLELSEALARVYATDAHLVTYLVGDGPLQCRVNKPGLHEAPSMPRIECFFCDVDNASHAEWTDDFRAAARAQEASLAVLTTAGIYDTAHGRRIVQPIAVPLAVDVVEPYLHRWLRGLEDAGIAVDWQCTDWTRQFRLPNVHRGGHDYRSPYIALDRMRAIELAPLAADDVATAARSNEKRARGTPRPIRNVDWTRELPEVWRAKVTRIAEAVRTVESEWHSLFLILAGALLSRGAPPEHVPALCLAIAHATGADTRPSDREAAGRTTVQRKLAGHAVKGLAELRRRYPLVADAVDASFASGADARARAHARVAAEQPPPPDLVETTAALERAIRDAADGLSLVSAECGLGKTQAAIRVAVARAQKTKASGSGDRAPTQSKTSISVDKNDLAIQIAADVRKTVTPVKRLFGPLSMRREDGTPECRYHTAATPLVEGGQSLKLTFCEGRSGPRCEHYAQCRARTGFDGDDNARIVVGPHALLAVANAEAGTTGLLVIDEPPSLLETASFTVAQLDAVLEARFMFAVRYAAAMAPALRAVRAWVAAAVDFERVISLSDAVRESVCAVEAVEIASARIAVGVPPSGDVAADILACVANSLGASPRSTAPPIQSSFLYTARRDVALAQKIGAASKVLTALRFALTTDERVAARVEDVGKSRVLMLTHARPDLVEAVRREGATVILDASADLHAPILEKVVDYAPRVSRFTARDGAPIVRTMLQTGKATRRNWFVQGRIVVKSGVVGAVERVLAWAAEDAETKAIGLVTFRPLALAVTIAARGDGVTKADREAWERIRQRNTDLEPLVELIRTALARWNGVLKVGHYGAVRGLDTMKNVDAMVTLGDPWPQLGIVQHDVAFLGLADPWERRLEGLCRAELEQAHGRLRVVHRARPGRALHVGNVLPGGSGWCDGKVAYRKLVGGRPRAEETLPRDELLAIVERLGGIESTAREVGCALVSMVRYVNAERNVPAALAVELRRRTETAAPAEAAAE